MSVIGLTPCPTCSEAVTTSDAMPARKPHETSRFENLIKPNIEKKTNLSRYPMGHARRRPLMPKNPDLYVTPWKARKRPFDARKHNLSSDPMTVAPAFERSPPDSVVQTDGIPMPFFVERVLLLPGVRVVPRPKIFPCLGAQWAHARAQDGKFSGKSRHANGRTAGARISTNDKGATTHRRNPLILLVPKPGLEPGQAYAH